MPSHTPAPHPFVRTVASGMVATALPRPLPSEQHASAPRVVQQHTATVTPMPSMSNVASIPNLHSLPQNLSVPAPGAPLQPVDLPKLLRSLEDSYIQAALTQTKGNRKAAADLLGLQRTTLVEKLRRRKKAGEPTPGAEPVSANSED